MLKCYQKFNVILNNFPSFKDKRMYNGEKVYFYKLAQLLTSDIIEVGSEYEVEIRASQIAVLEHIKNRYISWTWFST